MTRYPFKNILRVLAAAALVAFGAAEASFAAPAEGTIDRVDEYEWLTVKVLRKIKLPGGYHEGLYYDGKDMWVCNGRKGNIWVMDLASGKVKFSIRSIGTFTESVSYGGDGTYYVSDWDAMKLYRAKLENNKLVPLKDMSFEPSRPAGAIFTGDRLYVITWTRGMGTRFHLLEMDRDGHLLSVRLIRCVQEPSQLAWDGRYLWMTSWYSKLVYKIDPYRWKAVGVFASPVSDATGIVWIGNDLWITGTHGDLYQLKVGG